MNHESHLSLTKFEIMLENFCFIRKTINLWFKYDQPKRSPISMSYSSGGGGGASFLVYFLGSYFLGSYFLASTLAATGALLAASTSLILYLNFQ